MLPCRSSDLCLGHRQTQPSQVSPVAGFHQGLKAQASVKANTAAVPFGIRTRFSF